MTTPPVPARIIRRRRMMVAGAALVVALLVGGAAGAPVTARLFDVLVAVATVVAAWALAREVRTTLPPAAVIAPPTPRHRALADAA